MSQAYLSALSERMLDVLPLGAEEARAHWTTFDV